MMGKLATMEAPGGAGLYVKCPNCSKMYNPTDSVPRSCKRCGAPMDIGEALGFANAQAEEPKTAATRGAPRGRRNRMIDEAPTAKAGDGSSSVPMFLEVPEGDEMDEGEAEQT